jgi:hypothetical protein
VVIERRLHSHSEGLIARRATLERDRGHTQLRDDAVKYTTTGRRFSRLRRVPLQSLQLC